MLTVLTRIYRPSNFLKVIIISVNVPMKIKLNRLKFNKSHADFRGMSPILQSLEDDCCHKASFDGTSCLKLDDFGLLQWYGVLPHHPVCSLQHGWSLWVSHTDGIVEFANGNAKPQLSIKERKLSLSYVTCNVKIDRY